jgi:signal transduction histidine kinase
VDLSLKWKYILGTTLIVLLILGIFSWQSLRLQEKQIVDDDRERVALITEIIKNGLITIMLEGRGREFQKFLETVVAEDIEEVRIFKPNGTIVSSSIPYEIGKKIYSEDIDQYLKQAKPDVFIHTRNEKPVYSMVVPIYNEPVCQNCHGREEKIRGILDVEVSMDKTFKRLSMFRQRMVFFSILTLLALSLSLVILTKYLINRPIEGIIDTMKKVESGDLHARFSTERTDEIGKLSSNLNSMLSQLETAQGEIEQYHREEFRRIEKMATIGELASAIAHEIKNPLAGISGAIQVFSEDFSPGDPRLEVIDDVIREIERLDKAVRDLLNFASPPAARPLPTDVHSMMERLIHVIAQQAEKQNIDINLISTGEKLTLCLDPEQFQQVFLNIALNAFHSMPEGGKLDIEVRKNDNSVEFSFTDTGFGISEKDIYNVFKPFFTTKQSGTGLGLAISKNIIERHGGTIEVMSAPKAGSTFKITVPLLEPEDDRVQDPCN